jgi:hypothetical protein
LSAVSRVHEVGARLVCRLQVVEVSFDDYPAVNVIEEVDIANDVFGRSILLDPSLAAILGHQQSAFGADDPTAVLIEKEDRVEPG